MADFWEARDEWLAGWRLEESDESHLKVDYVKVFAL